jgi:hypothetical protein
VKVYAKKNARDDEKKWGNRKEKTVRKFSFEYLACVSEFFSLSLFFFKGKIVLRHIFTIKNHVLW